MDIRNALMEARLTALSKPLGGVIFIATGSTIRRLVARTLAKQFMEEFEAECAPFQYTLLTRAGTDCVGHLLHATTDADPRVTVLSVDGIGAYDHVLRSAMLGRLASMPGARSLLPFVRMSYAQLSSYQLFDDQGAAHVVTQAEGGEQGDPLMPLLFSISIQGALEEVVASLLPGEQLCAFLDDLYLLCDPSSSRQHWQGSLEFSCTKGRRGLGTEQVSSQTTLTNWDQRFGNLKGSRCLTRQSAQNSTSHRRWNVWPKREGVVGSDPDSARSAVCLAASAPKRKQTLGRTTPCAPCPPQCFSCVLPPARRGHVGHCQNIVGWSPRSE